MTKYAIIVAGGKGLRMGSELPKQFIPVGGKPILMRTLARFAEAESDVRLILVLPASQREFWQNLCAEYNFELPHIVVDGGQTRFHSVKNGLQKVIELEGEGNTEKDMNATSPTGSNSTMEKQSRTSALVAVHDGVRPFVSADVIRRCYDTSEQTGAAVPVIPVVETLRQLSSTSGETTYGESRTVPRDDYRLVQTPQTFSIELLKAAFQQPYKETFTDDASVVEAYGHAVTLVEGNRENIKLTTPFDLTIAEALVSQIG
ncbi:MAG: 2-C-methyl-D-erythritol 4-phosphate cytidylyltransferase [Bacteroidaceae bacterium]|nr:2-C-methyl-D-erythritol 4-phosphate cytidylyltransferase [Bacteroidaceae bacterium]